MSAPLCTRCAACDCADPTAQYGLADECDCACHEVARLTRERDEARAGMQTLADEITRWALAHERAETQRDEAVTCIRALAEENHGNRNANIARAFIARVDGAK